MPIRRRFRQYVNLRPIRLLRGLRSPLNAADAEGIDFVVVRENVEGEYSEIGGRLYTDQEEEVVLQTSAFTRVGVERILSYALELAAARGGRLVSATKSNGLRYSMPFWDQMLAEVAAGHPEVTTSSLHIDALVAQFVLRPWTFDVVVASNLFGDILTDLGAALVGGIGVAPSANLDPTGEHPSMFEPIHGSAPDIAGRGIANPIGQIWSVALMLEHLGHPSAATHVIGAIEDALVASTARTPDLGGTARTMDVTREVLDALGNRLATGAGP
jgi:tartrate dehydrogenase/decarboxylase/D-malate dehydrogenase